VRTVRLAPPEPQLAPGEWGEIWIEMDPLPRGEPRWRLEVWDSRGERILRIDSLWIEVLRAVHHEGVRP
jgi:hypothetical protein